MEDEVPLIRWCDAMALLLDLPIEAADRAEVIASLRVIAQQMRLITDFPLDDRIEPAPIFRA
jgi:hypothetical protein